MRSVASSLTVAAVYLVCTLLFTEYRHVFEFNPDEGNNLVKAMLLQQGLTFSSGIWSDQPPLFAYLLLGCFELFGTNIAVARGLVLFSSAVLVFAVHGSVRSLASQRFGESAAQLGAAVAVAGLVLSGRFAPLRVSVLIGIPSIALLTLALWAALAARGPRLQLTAGACLGLSLAIKLFTLFVAPIVYLTLLAQLGTRSPRPLLHATLWFAAGLGLVLVAVFAPLSTDAFLELFRSHVDAEFDRIASGSMLAMLSMDGPLYLAALASLPLLLRVRLMAGVPWLTWLALGIGVLSVHHPLWLHHSQLLVVPAAVLAGLGAAALLGTLPEPERLRAAIGFATVLAIALPLTASERVQRLRHPAARREGSHERRALEAIQRAQPMPGRMITARQIFAFYLHRPIPAELAVTSIKRLSTQGFSSQKLIALIHAPDTQLVLLSDRWPNDLCQQLRAAMRDRFEQLYSDVDEPTLEVWARRK